MRGQRLPLSIIIPFSVEVSSLGRPQIFQDWIYTGIPRKFLIVTAGSNNKLLSASYLIQDFSS